MENKKLTGYPSIDKPWLKYYSEEAINTPLPECSVYEYMAQNNRREPNRIALDYFDRKITYGELLDNIDRAANAFYNLGICKGDVVAGIAPGFPEIIYSFYALNKIGAVSDWFDPRTSPDIILKELRETKAKAEI